MLDEDVIIDKTHIVKMNLNPIFKLLISKLDTSKNHDEKSSRLQPGFD
jgi:hypothetical protein